MSQQLPWWENQFVTYWLPAGKVHLCNHSTVGYIQCFWREHQAVQRTQDEVKDRGVTSGTGLTPSTWPLSCGHHLCPESPHVILILERSWNGPEVWTLSSRGRLMITWCCRQTDLCASRGRECSVWLKTLCGEDLATGAGTCRGIPCILYILI